MKLNTSILRLKTDKKLSCGAGKVRGFIGNEFRDHTLLHNHYGSSSLFSYPLVQYKVIDGDIVILGIEEGADIINEIAPKINSLKLDRSYEVEERILSQKTVDVKPSSEERHYEFITPWIGLNQKNHGKFNDLKDWKEKKDFLNRIIVGNLLSMSKGLGIVVNKRLYAKSRLEFRKVEYKSVVMNAFVGQFKVHYDIPDFFALGKGVSHGFGTVRQIVD